MHRSFAFATLAATLSLGACESYTWERAGATDLTMQTDYRDCRQQAQSEAFRSYAFYSGFPLMGPIYWGYRYQPDYWYWRQRLDSERFFYENRLTNFCMRNKGYTLVKVNEDVKAVPPGSVPPETQTPPPATPGGNTKTTP
jgi:hypothetical protein